MPEPMTPEQRAEIRAEYIRLRRAVLSAERTVPDIERDPDYGADGVIYLTPEEAAYLDALQAVWRLLDAHPWLWSPDERRRHWKAIEEGSGDDA